MYIHIITILNVTFLDTCCICSRKNGGKWCLCFNTSYFTYFWHSFCRKLTKSLALHGCGEIFAHPIWFISSDTSGFCSPILRKTEIFCIFFFMQNLEKRSYLWKNGYYWKFELQVSYQVWFCWQISNDCIMACLK